MPTSPPTRDGSVDLRDVSFTYPGAETSALDRVSLRVEPGERLGILGPNGGGKSTLLKLVLGLLKPSTGSISVAAMPPADARRRALIGYVPQRPEAELALPVSVREMVALAITWRRNPLLPPSKHDRDRVESVLRLVGAEAFADRAVGRLSGGQLQRAMIARAVAPGPRILILDEPTVGIDAAGQQMFADLMARVHRELGLTLLVVSHDLRAIAAGCDRVACLARRLHSHGSPAGLTPQVLAEVFSHDVAGIAGFGGLHLHAHPAGPDHACVACGPEAPATNTPAPPTLPTPHAPGTQTVSLGIDPAAKPPAGGRT